MKPNSLLRELNVLTHDARMRRMAELGKTARTEPTVLTMLDTLEKRGFHERLLALQSCYGSRDAARALRAMADPSRTIQFRALRPIALFAADPEVEQALAAARYKHRLVLLRELRRGGRFRPVDAFLDTLAESDLSALALLLPYASPAVVRKHFAAARQLGGSVFWKRLARAHAEFAAEVLISDLRKAATPDARLVQEADAVLNLLAARRPELALDLARALAMHVPLTRILAGLYLLSRRRPSEVADLLLDSSDSVRLSLDRVARRLDPQRLQALLERRPGTLVQPQLWFRRLPPASRASVFRALERCWRNSEGCVSPLLVASLPGPLRQQEARRNLGLPALATRPEQRLPYAAFLPWDEALAVLDPWLKHPEGELRALAIQTLAGSTRYERSRLGDLLKFATARKHEQDPVRCRMLAGLADLPPGAWRVEHLEALGQVLRDALSASDLSAATAAHAQRLVVALLPFHPDWSAEWIATLVRERGEVNVGNLQDRLNDDDVRRIAPALLPVLRSWRNRERQAQLATFAQCVGRRIPAFEGLAELLEREVLITRTQWSADYILILLAKQCRERIHSLVPRLLEKDKSWATRATVYLYLHRRRQDLLTPFLGQHAYKGRFSTGRTRFVLPLAGGFFRWTPAQQELFQKTLQEVVRARKRPHDTPTVLQATRQLAALPAVDVKPLARLASDKRLAVQEGTLRVLGRLDAGQGIPILLEAMGDERARVAIYSLRGAVLEMPPDRAVALLRGVSMAKVTVAKECVRLLGDIATDTAYAELRRLDGEELHRDVRVALLRALWGHLERPEAWTILERAVESPDPALMNSVVRIPADRLSEVPRQRLLVVLLRLLDHPDPLLRLQVLQRLVSLPVADPRHRLLPGLTRKLSSPLPDERQAAAVAVFANCKPQDAERLAKVFKTLLPQRRALLALVHAFRATVGSDRRRLTPVADAVLAVLKRDPLTVELRIGLASETLSWRELAEELEQMGSAGELHADSLASVMTRLGNWVSRTDNADLAHLEAELASKSDERLRRLALAALVVQASLAGGWSESRLDRLRRYREDTSPLVAAAAQFTLPAEEEKPTELKRSTHG
jgi:hypothetical protein